MPTPAHHTLLACALVGSLFAACGGKTAGEGSGTGSSGGTLRRFWRIQRVVQRRNRAGPPVAAPVPPPAAYPARPRAGPPPSASTSILRRSTRHAPRTPTVSLFRAGRSARVLASAAETLPSTCRERLGTRPRSPGFRGSCARVRLHSRRHAAGTPASPAPAGLPIRPSAARRQCRPTQASPASRAPVPAAGAAIPERAASKAPSRAATARPTPPRAPARTRSARARSRLGKAGRRAAERPSGGARKTAVRRPSGLPSKRAAFHFSRSEGRFRASGHDASGRLTRAAMTLVRDPLRPARTHPTLARTPASLLRLLPGLSLTALGATACHARDHSPPPAPTPAPTPTPTPTPTPAPAPTTCLTHLASPSTATGHAPTLELTVPSRLLPRRPRPLPAPDLARVPRPAGRARRRQRRLLRRSRAPRRPPPHRRRRPQPRVG